MYYLWTNEFMGATVITNLLSAIPVFGPDLVELIGEDLV